MSIRPPDSRHISRHPAFRMTHLAAACGILIGGAGSAIAQQQAAAAPAPAKQEGEQIETVVVTGIRKSLDTSLSLKRDASGIVDGIVAEDIGKFPDTNLAESMQRISGVSIDRSVGEGSKVTVRGIGPEFNLVLLNGRQMPASGIVDTGASGSRAFDFANLASESIAALEVYKTSRAASPAGGMGATINIKTARPLENPGFRASLGAKAMYDESNNRIPDSLRGSQVTPEISGIYSDTFADGTFGVAISGSYQERNLGLSYAGVPNGWRSFRGDENNWGTIPQPGQPGSENITNRPGPNDVYSVPQNINYGVSGIQRQRTNGQLTLQWAPMKELTTTLDYTYSELKLQTKRNELSAWFNFGPSSSSWTDGPVAGPIFYSETIVPATSDIAMGGAKYATKNTNDSLGLNVAWKASNNLNFEFDTHHSSAESGADSPYGSNAVLGTASFNRGTTSVDFSKDFPVLSIEGSQLDPSLMMVTGSSFRNSYMKSEIDQTQVKGRYKFEDASKLDFGMSLTDANNRSAYSNVQRDTWGGATNAGDYPDSVWHPDKMGRYFGSVSGSNSSAFFNNFYTWDFDEVRALAAQAAGDESLYRASNVFTTDRRVNEKSQSAFVQYSTDWEWGVPMGMAAGLRYEHTDITSKALVPIATGISWVSNNEFSVAFGAPEFTKLKGSYTYVLPSIDFDADITSKLKARVSYGESIGRPQWDYIQGGQTLNQLARIDGGTGSQGNPALKPLKSKNIDLSLEYYYAKGSYIAAGYFAKNLSNYVGVTTTEGTPFNLHTPANGALFQEAVSTGGCTDSDLTCIRNYIFANYNGTRGVTQTGTDGNGNAVGTIAGQSDDPIATFQITTYSNQHKARLYGVELNWQHMFGSTGFGVSSNYTYVNSGLKYKNGSLGEQFALEGLSDTANLVVFYENDTYEARLAYNWRDQFLAARFDGSGLPNPVYTEPYSQLDFSAGYKWNDNLSFQFEAINLNDAVVRQHGRTNNAIIGVWQTGPRYTIGARYKF
ncbi:TonB-dependent receptor [Ideonella sp. DXS29W]|uniref:TonB-dependent receptor n=1 Tax=Ideonella lacteola TaxID=2984193 RepID=A0ABU9BW38_9BURK